MKTMTDNHNLYLKCDVLLIADVFEKFRNNSLKELWIMFESLFDRTSFKVGWDALYEKSWAWTYSRTWYLIFLIDIAKPTIGI